MAHIMKLWIILGCIVACIITPANTGVTKRAVVEAKPPSESKDDKKPDETGAGVTGNGNPETPPGGAVKSPEVMVNTDTSGDDEGIQPGDAAVEGDGKNVSVSQPAANTGSMAGDGGNGSDDLGSHGSDANGPPPLAPASPKLTNDPKKEPAGNKVNSDVAKTPTNGITDSDPSKTADTIKNLKPELPDDGNGPKTGSDDKSSAVKNNTSPVKAEAGNSTGVKKEGKEGDLGNDGANPPAGAKESEALKTASEANKTAVGIAPSDQLGVAGEKSPSENKDGEKTENEGDEGEHTGDTDETEPEVGKDASSKQPGGDKDDPAAKELANSKTESVEEEDTNTNSDSASPEHKIEQIDTNEASEGDAPPVDEGDTSVEQPEMNGDHDDDKGEDIKVDDFGESENEDANNDFEDGEDDDVDEGEGGFSNEGDDDNDIEFESDFENKAISREDLEEEEEKGQSHFFAFLLTLMFCTAALYLMYHNKRKVVALVFPGTQRRTGTRHRGGYKANYEKLENKPDKTYVF